jgi:ornithine carbamoyltransferase
MTHFLDIHTTPTADLRAIIDDARRMKDARAGLPKGTPDTEQPLANHMVALIFEKPSTRTRVSFDVGVRQMGGQTMVLSGADMQLGHGETIADTARVLSRYVDMIMIRTFEEATLHEMAEHATVPVINGLTNRVFASFAHAAKQFDFDLVFSGPPPLDPERALDGLYTIERDPQKAVQGADLVVTDTWVSMHDPQSARERRHNQLRGYQVTETLMGQANKDALFMHCLPAHRDDEVTSAVMDGPHSVIFDEAENRLHAQKAVMRYCLK